MKKLIKVGAVIASILSLCCTVCSAEVYQQDIPSFCPIQGGAWCDVETVEGRACFVVPDTYRFSVFGFQGVSGYSIANVTNATVSGHIYFENSTGWYESPKDLQCRFTSFGTLEVYAPYYQSSSYNPVRYQWETLEIQSINNTNIALMDEAGDRQNNQYLYTTSEKLLIFVCCLLAGLILLFLLRSAWRA